MDVEVISKETIKPSTPTPKHRQIYKFSFTDQISPSFYIPLIYFYNLNDHKLGNNIISGDLKKSLSKVLTHYYPLAGCLNDDYVDCNDKGVLFLEAKVKCNLSQIIGEPNPRKLNKFLPDHVKNFILAIQVNFFDCGNIAIGACVSHKIADASTFITFIKNWAAAASFGGGGGDDSVKICPELLSATLFPPRDVGESCRVSLPAEKNIVCKSFVFRGSRIAALKEKYAGGIHPTRVEALSAFIWSRFAASTEIKIGPERVSMLVHAVNLRKRMDPPQPDDSFGNISGPTATIISEDIGEECYGLVKMFRDAIGKINKDYAKKLQEGVFEHFGLLGSINDDGFDRREVVNFYYTSLCRFPLYEADFGWGKPIWVAWGGWPYRNIAVLMDTKCGNGIEAWIHLKEEDMVKFEADKEFLSYVSPTSCAQRMY